MHKNKLGRYKEGLSDVHALHTLVPTYREAVPLKIKEHIYSCRYGKSSFSYICDCEIHPT